MAIYHVITTKTAQGDFRFVKLFVDLRQQIVEETVAQRARYGELLQQVLSEIKAKPGKLDDKLAETLNETIYRINNPIDL